MSDEKLKEEVTLDTLNARVTELETKYDTILIDNDMKSKLNSLPPPPPPTSTGGRRQKQRQQKQQKQKQKQQQQSGGDASNHAIDVFGGLGQQQAQAGSNVIASRPGQAGGSGLSTLAPSELSAGSPVPPSAPVGGDASVQKGGKRRTRKNKKQKQQRKTKHSRQ